MKTELKLVFGHCLQKCDPYPWRLDIPDLKCPRDSMFLFLISVQMRKKCNICHQIPDKERKIHLNGDVSQHEEQATKNIAKLC